MKVLLLKIWSATLLIMLLLMTVTVIATYVFKQAVVNGNVLRLHCIGLFDAGKCVRFV